MHILYQNIVQHIPKRQYHVQFRLGHFLVIFGGANENDTNHPNETEDEDDQKLSALDALINGFEEDDS